jgi:hypothetical protein
MDKKHHRLHERNRAPVMAIGLVVLYHGPTHTKGSRLSITNYREVKIMRRYLSYDNIYNGVMEQATDYIYTITGLEPIAQVTTRARACADTLVYNWWGDTDYFNPEHNGNNYEIIKEKLYNVIN